MRPAEHMLRKRDAIWAKHGHFSLAPPPEVIEKRTQTGKVFDLGGGKFHTSVSIGAVHYRDELGCWQEIDTDLRAVEYSGGLQYVCDKAPYVCITKPEQVAWTYLSRSGGDIRVELATVNGQPVDYSNMKHRVEGDVIFWDNVAPGVDIKLCMYRNGVEDFKRFREPTILTWNVSQSADFAGTFQEKLKGWDRDGDVLEVLTAHSYGVFREEWTGRVSEVVDRKTRRKGWKAAPRVPVVVDAAITENVVVNVDDGNETIGYTAWGSVTGTNNNLALGFSGESGFIFHGGVRFRALALPNSSTVSASTLTVKKVSIDGAPQAKIYADDVDDAALWANGNLPSGITKTTALKAWTPVGTGLTTVDVKNVASEVFVRTGWASNNDIRFGLLNIVASGATATIQIEDYNAAGTDEAQFDVTFTPPNTGFANLPLLGVG